MKKKIIQKQKLPATPTIEEQQQLLNLYNQGLFDEAVAGAEEFIADFPEHGFGWMILGGSFQKLKKPVEVLNAKRKSVEFLPNNEEASDALWAGIPLVTKMGETFASRVAGSILHTTDLAELVTTNDDDYFNVALSLAQKPEKLAAIKQKIAVQKHTSLLFDTQKFARDLERLYQTIWAQELKGERKAVVLEAETKAAKREFHPQFITDENSENKFVILPFAEWEQILNALGEK